MRHKHADLIHAWAEGAEIEYFSFSTAAWRTINGVNLTWDEYQDYRIKPTPKPDVVRDVETDQHRTLDYSVLRGKNLRLVFDGETGALKSAEVLK